MDLSSQGLPCRGGSNPTVVFPRIAGLSSGFSKKGETGKDYISRCVKQVMAEGKTQKQALGQCYGMLRQKRGKIKNG